MQAGTRGKTHAQGYLVSNLAWPGIFRKHLAQFFERHRKVYFPVTTGAVQIFKFHGVDFYKFFCVLATYANERSAASPGNAVNRFAVGDIGTTSPQSPGAGGRIVQRQGNALVEGFNDEVGFGKILVRLLGFLEVQSCQPHSPHQCRRNENLGKTKSASAKTRL